MELSICIPIFNKDVSPLVRELRRQALDLSCVFEILLMDDGSTEYLTENGALDSLECVRYMRLERNVGRSAVRNRLADEALYEYLIFMDCDVYPDSSSFLRDYLRMEGADVVVGGYCYGDEPTSKAHLLRWKYGKNREERSAEERGKRPNDSFSTFNFMIRKSLFERVRFDESLCGYGHEDTLFGLCLKRAGIEVTHIDNPLTHLSYDASELFLEKSGNSVRNLWDIYCKVEDADSFADSVKLLRCFRRLDGFGLTKVMAALFPLTERIFRWNLLGGCPSLFLFDLYKLFLLCVCSRR